MGILQARTLEWVAMPSSTGSSGPRGRTCASCVLHWQPGSLPLAPVTRVQILVRPLTRQATLDTRLLLSVPQFLCEREGSKEQHFLPAGVVGELSDAWTEL